MIRASTFLALLVMASLLAATAAYVAGGRAPPTTPASVAMAVVKGLPTPMTGLDIPGAWVPKKAMPKDSGTSPLTIADVSAAAALGAVPSPGVLEPPTASVESLFERAAHLEQIGQHEEAISTLKSIAKMTPGDGKVWMKLMNAHKRRGQLELAERAVAAGIDANPSNARLQQARADICRTQKRFPEAAKHFRRAMELDKSLASVYDSWGRMEVRPRAPPEAPAPPRAAPRPRRLRDAKRPSPSRLFSQAQLGNPSEAAALFQKGLALQPTARLYHALGVLQDSCGQADAARASLRAGLALPGEDANPQLLHALGVAEVRAEKPARARAHWRAALDASPTFTLAHVSLGQLEERLGNAQVRDSTLNACPTRGNPVDARPN